MFFKNIPKSVFVLVCLISTPIWSETFLLQPARLELVPNQCVALRKGRECFASINVDWQTPTVGDYCLRRQFDQLVIHCWDQKNQGDFVYIFRAKNAEILELIYKQSNKVVMVASINVSWVYKSKKRKRRWRVF